MFNRNDYVAIMTGDFNQLNWVCRFLRVSGVAATVKVNSLSTQAQLIVEANKETKARVLSREYVESCTRQRLINIKMEEIFGKDEEDEESAV